MHRAKHYVFEMGLKSGEGRRWPEEAAKVFQLPSCVVWLRMDAQIASQAL